MVIRRNGLYNDPALGQAFDNIASMFAPPSGSDLAGYASANATKQEAARLAHLYAQAQNPEVALEALDRLNYAARGNANNTFIAIDRNNQNALDQQRLVNEGELAKLYATPVEVKENATVYVPGQHSANSGLNPVLTGQTSVGQGERVIRADGAEFTGAPKPMTDSELKAVILGGLPENEQRAAALGSTPVTNVVTPEGPRIQFQADAVGMEPYFNKGAEAKPQNAVALMPDRKTRVPAVQGPDGKWVHAQTGQQLPEGIEIFDLPKAEGSAADVGFAPTTANATSANNQEAEVSRTLNLLDIYESALDNNPGALGLAGLVRGTAQNAVATATDLARAFGGTAPEVAAAAEDLRAGLQGVAPDLFDPSIPEIAFLQGTLAYSLARTENPSGEVSRQAYERALERVKGGGMLANTQSAKAAVQALRKVVNSQLEGIRTLRAPGTGRTDTTYQPPAASDAPIEKWDIIDGKLQRVQ